MPIFGSGPSVNGLSVSGRRGREEIYIREPLLGLALTGILFLLAACGGSDAPVLRVGGIPDQDASRLVRRYGGFAEYLSRNLGVEVEYIPIVDYAAVVTAFSQGKLDLAFFGGLTGVQARLLDRGAQAIVQQEHDAEFHSKFIVRNDVAANTLGDLSSLASDLTITFGSESSTSGHLMPRHFLQQTGLDADSSFKSPPNYSGSHDLTWRLVESGASDIGALNEDVGLQNHPLGDAPVPDLPALPLGSGDTTTVVVGFVSAGGLGREFRLSLSFFQYTDVALMIFWYLVLVMAVGLLSAFLRRMVRAG